MTSALATAVCGGGDVPAGDPRSEPSGFTVVECEAAADPLPADPELGVPAGGPLAGGPATSAAAERYQQLRVDTLRLMIAAARLALPIGPFQQRIDCASRTAVTRTTAEAADIMEEVAAGLQGAIEDAQP